MFELTRPRHGDDGWCATWIAKDHAPGPDDDYDCARAEYEYRVFETRNEAKDCLLAHYMDGGVEWGYIAAAKFEYGDWSNDFDSIEWYYELGETS